MRIPILLHLRRLSVTGARSINPVLLMTDHDGVQWSN